MGKFKVGVSCIVKNEEGKILMVKEGKEHIRGRWDFPGGGMDKAESIEECGRREVEEETGFRVETENLLGIYFEKNLEDSMPAVHFVLRASIKSESAKDPDFEDEILDEKFFEIEELEKLELRKENRYDIIQDLKDGKKINLENLNCSDAYRKLAG